MKPLLQHLSAACTGAMLLACAGVVQRGDAPPASAEQNYLLARGHHLAQRTEQAVALYTAALRSAPAHRNARNGLAALHAEQGQLDKAIPVWEELTQASSGGSADAFLFINLGHAYVLRGDYARGQEMLEQACLRDPLNARAWEHLGTALAKQGQHKRARIMQRQAETLRGYDIKSDYAVARGTAAPAVDAALRSASPADGFARTEVERDSAGVFILRRIDPPADAKLAAAAPDFEGNVLFEISNGNGITGMARSLAQEAGQGARSVRLTNQKGFAVRHTRVEYKVAFKGDAERVASRFGTTRVVQVGNKARADVRLVLGRDFVKPAPRALAVTPAPAKPAG